MGSETPAHEKIVRVPAEIIQGAASVYVQSVPHRFPRPTHSLWPTRQPPAADPSTCANRERLCDRPCHQGPITQFQPCTADGGYHVGYASDDVVRRDSGKTHAPLQKTQMEDGGDREENCYREPDRHAGNVRVSVETC